MVDTSYDILFAGEITPGADPEGVRQRIQDLFRLKEQAVDRLFGGQPVAVKRGVDAATANLYRERFLGAGAVVQVIPSATAPLPAPRQPGARPVAKTNRRDAQAPPTASPVGQGLQLAPPGNLPLESPPTLGLPEIDTSHLSLIPGDDWTLEDCAPPQLPRLEPDISHLRLVEPDPESEPPGDGK